MANEQNPLGNLLVTLDDGISAVQFCDSLLAAGSWDRHIHIYDTQTHLEKISLDHGAAVLDLYFANKGLLFSGGLDKNVKSFDVTNGKETILGSHEKAVKCVQYAPEKNVVVSGSWDASVKLWDHREKKCISSHPQPDKVFAMSLLKDTLVVGTARRQILIYDLRAMNDSVQQRESSLRFQTRCIKIYPDGTGFAVSSIEGRVAMEYFDQAPEVQKNKYAFKCHRRPENGVDVVYPVNTIAFHQGYGTFATGGCDGIVNTWDGKNKKRLAQIGPYNTSISALAFNQEGTTLAVASSYTFEEGEKDAPPDQIYLRPISDIEIKPKIVAK
jgi:cell cycle arrest protein BUB3